MVDDIELEAKLTRTRWLKAVSVMAQYRMVLLEATFYLAVATLIFQVGARAAGERDDSPCRTNLDAQRQKPITNA